MSYAHYDVEIVQQHKVKLVGWPSTVPFEPPSAINSMEHVRTLYDNLKVGTCRFVHLTNSELKAHNEKVAKAVAAEKKDRGPRADKGKKRGPNKRTTGKENAAADGEGSASTGRKRKSGSNQGQTSGDPPPARKRRKTSSRSVASQLPPQPTSREFIDSDEDNDD